MVLLVIAVMMGISCSAKSSKKKNDNYWTNYGNQWAQWGASWAHGVPTTQVPSGVAGVALEGEDSSSVSGYGSFENKEIKKELTIYGSGNFKKVNAHKKVTVHGAATVHDSTFKDIIVYGYLNGVGSTFADVMLYSNKSDFDDCTIASLTVESKNKKPTIKLTDTIIKGDVEFKGKKGKIVLKGTAKIQGNIINGTVIKK